MRVAQDKCDGSAKCISVCPTEAIELKLTDQGEKAEIDESRCLTCGQCIEACPTSAISVE